MNKPFINSVNHSLLDIFKIGPGPSSSHTIGPMLAANDFARRHPEIRSAEIHLFGSLAHTGEGHGSVRAAAAGFCGMRPETCDTGKLAAITANEKQVFTGR